MGQLVVVVVVVEEEGSVIGCNSGEKKNQSERLLKERGSW